MCQGIYVTRYAEYIDVCSYLNTAKPGMPSLCMGVQQELQSFKVCEECSPGLLIWIIYREPQKCLAQECVGKPKKTVGKPKKTVGTRRNAQDILEQPERLFHLQSLKILHKALSNGLLHKIFPVQKSCAQDFLS